MKILEYYSCEDQEHWLEQIKKSDWGAGQFLYELLRDGRRRIGKLLEYAYALAKTEGHEHIYISTGEDGLYEKYGYHFWKIMEDMHGEASRIYRTEITSKAYTDILGTVVSGTIDRPLGSAHPRHPEKKF